MKNKLFIFLILISILINLSAENNQKVYSIDSDIYSHLDLIYREAGMVSPFSSAPYSKEEILFYLNNISKKNLSPAGQKAYSSIENEINKEALYKTEGMDFDISVKINFETYFHTNEDKEFWEHGYEDRKAFIEVPMEIWVQDSLYLTSELAIKEEPFVVTEESDNKTSAPAAIEYVEGHAPFRAFASTGGKHWNVQFGRDTLNWGNAKSSNLMLSDNADFHDVLKFSAYWKSFKFTTAYINLEPWRGYKEKEANGEWSDWTYIKDDLYPTIDESELVDDAYDLPGEDSFKAFFGHRLEFKPNDKLELVVSESIIFGGKYPDLQYMNPLMVYHNWYIPEYANSLATIESKIKVLRHTDFYFQYAMDQFQTESEKDNFESASDDPNAFGVLVGINQIVPTKNAYFDFTFEWVYTNPWLYTADSRVLSYASRRRIVSNLGSTGTKLYRDRCLGFEYGPDTNFFYLEASFDNLEKLKSTIDFRYRETGDNNFYTPYGSVENATSLTTPSGDDPLKEFTAHAFIGIEINKEWSFGTDFYWVNYWNYGEDKENLSDFEFSIGISYIF